MKRLILTLVSLAVAGMALAQSPFTIVRPADGSKVREDVHLLFPKGSIPDGGYVGIWVNGQFIEAVVPTEGQKFMDYTLHTKALELPDGPTTIEAVLYVDFEEKPRILDRSSIQVTLANKANIPVPDEGFLLRYKWHPGEAIVYNWDSDISVSNISEAQAKLGGHAAETSIQNQSARVVYNVDNTYPTQQGLDALLRIQLEPPAGKTSATLATLSSPFPKLFYARDFSEVYSRVHDTGSEVYGQIPPFFSNFGINGSAPDNPLYALIPLPVLPTGRVRPGDIWNTRFQLGAPSDVGRVNLLDSTVEKIPARGEFVGLEWEMGSPCAKLHRTISVGTGGAGEGANKIKSNAEAVDETCWFALDRGEIIKIVRTLTVDRKVEAAQTAPSNAPGGAGGPQGAGAATNGSSPSGNRPNKFNGMMRGGFGGGGGAAGGGGSVGPQGAPGGFNTPPVGNNGQGPVFPGSKGRGAFGGPPGPAGANTGFPGNRNGGANSNTKPATTTLVRIQATETYTLVR